VKDPQTDSVTTIKPMARDSFESKYMMGKRKHLSTCLSLELELRDLTCKFLYSTDNEVNLLDEKTFEEISIGKSMVNPATYNLLENGMILKVRLAQDVPVSLVLPRIIKCTVSEVLENGDGSVDKK
jgi:hypothetical protein